jgi:glucose-6-phosphate dehydrogenase assembly protein OpcA
MTSTGGERSASEEIAFHRHLMRFGEAESLAIPLWEDRDTSVRAVAAYLARLSDVSAEQEHQEGVVTEKGLAHARASVLNLIVTVVDEPAAERVVRTMLELGVKHPSRAVILVPLPGRAVPRIDARISTHCHESPARGERLCYEEVVLSVAGEPAEHLSGVVAPLLIHDLPTHVWWPGDPPFTDPVFDQLVDVSDRIIVDSSDFADLLGGMRRLATVRRRSGVGDMTWARLAWWHELTAQFFDAPRFRRYLPNLERLHVRYAVPPRAAPSDGATGLAAPLAQPLLFAGWLATRLGWRRYRTTHSLEDGRIEMVLEGRYEMVQLTIEPVETDRVRPGDLMAVRLRSLGEAGAAEFIVDRDPSGVEATVATNADGMTALLRRVQMDPATEAEMLSTQLAEDVSNPVYENALRAAAILLASAREVAA